MIGAIAAHYVDTAPSTAVVTDNFNRADTTSGLGTATSGHVWQPTSYAGARILSNQLASLTVAGDPCVTIDAGIADGYASATLLTGGQTDLSLIGRYTDNSNYWMAYQGAGASGKYGIWKRQGGSYASVAATTVVPAANDVVRLEFSGTTIRLLVNGAVIATATGQTFNQTATKYGFRRGDGAAATWDNFAVGA